MHSIENLLNSKADRREADIARARADGAAAGLPIETLEKGEASLRSAFLFADLIDAFRPRGS